MRSQRIVAAGEAKMRRVSGRPLSEIRSGGERNVAKRSADLKEGGDAHNSVSRVGSTSTLAMMRLALQ